MAFPKLVPDTTIQRIKSEETEHQKYLESIDYDPQFNVVEVAQTKQRKERWLELFSQCLSPQLACKQIGISTTTYRKWRQKDSWFCEQLNEIIGDWKGELLASTISRAVGYVREDENGNIETDAQGKVIRYGASDQLAKALLQLDDDAKGKSDASVTVVIDMGALTGRSVQDGLVFDEVGNVINDTSPSDEALNIIESGADTLNPDAGALNALDIADVADTVAVDAETEW